MTQIRDNLIKANIVPTEFAVVTCYITCLHLKWGNIGEMDLQPISKQWEEKSCQMQS